KEVLPQVKQRAVSQDTARKMTAMLEGVVTNGTGTKAAIPGFRVAGKTGTAQKIDSRTGTYSSTQFVGSFVGYVPAESPRLAMIIVLDEPQGEAWGGAVAAPVFRRVGEQVLNYLGVSREDTVKIALAMKDHSQAMARDPITLTQLVAALRGQVEVLEQRGDVSCPVHAITDDSRAVVAGSLFVAVKGERVDGHGFVEQAIKAGAVAVVAQASVASGPLPLVLVANSRKALGLLGSRFHGDPSARLKMIGVTGTNGKTTTTYLCKALLEGIGRQVGLIGTVGYQIGQETLPASHTTP